MAKFQELLQSNDLVLVDFHATWCGPCKALAPILKDLKQKVGDRLKIVKIDVDKHQGISTKLGVRGVPTMILYKNGKKVWRESGVIPLSQLLALVEANK